MERTRPTEWAIYLSRDSSNQSASKLIKQSTVKACIGRSASGSVNHSFKQSTINKLIGQSWMGIGIHSGPSCQLGHAFEASHIKSIEVRCSPNHMNNTTY